jgi:hypothetical protein
VYGRRVTRERYPGGRVRHSNSEPLVADSITYGEPMSDSKRPLVELLSGGVDGLATPANVRYGTAIHQRGGVEFVEVGAYRATAWVGGLDGDVRSGGGQRRRTRISSSKAGLRWHCTGNPKDHDIFCKHCVALALAVRDHRPG